MDNFKRIDTPANRLRLAMDEAGLRQVDLRRMTGIEKGSMSRYLKGDYEPKQDAIYKLAKALSVSEMWLWGYDCEKERSIEQINNDALADIVIRMRTDSTFFDVVKNLDELDAEKLAIVQPMLSALVKQPKY